MLFNDIRKRGYDQTSFTTKTWNITLFTTVLFSKIVAKFLSTLFVTHIAIKNFENQSKPATVQWLNAPGAKYHTARNGISFVNKSMRHGILPQLLEYLLSTRQAIKKNMKNPELGDRQKRILDFRQTAIKLVANTMYGYTAANYSGRMPMAELADTIVRQGSGGARGLFDLALESDSFLNP